MQKVIQLQKVTRLSVTGMIDPVGEGDICKALHIHTIEIGDVNTVFGGVRPALVVGVNAANRTEVMLCGVGAKCVERQSFTALFNAQIRQLDRGDHR